MLLGYERASDTVANADDDEDLEQGGLLGSDKTTFLEVLVTMDPVVAFPAHDFDVPRAILGNDANVVACSRAQRAVEHAHRTFTARHS